VVAKRNQILGLIKHSFIYKDIDVTKKLFIALVRPHLEYANTAWCPRYKKDVEQNEKVQRRAIKSIHTIQDMPHQKRLQFMDLIYGFDIFCIL